MRPGGEKITNVVKKNVIESVLNWRLFSSAPAMTINHIKTLYPIIHTQNSEKVSSVRHYFKLNSEHTTQVKVALLMLHTVGFDKYHSLDSIFLLDSVDSREIFITFEEIVPLIYWVLIQFCC